MRQKSKSTPEYARVAYEVSQELMALQRRQDCAALEAPRPESCSAQAGQRRRRHHHRTDRDAYCTP
jgi:hypothetical protein